MKSTDNRKPENFLDRTYLGTVKYVQDDKFAGRIYVWIPEFNTREDDPNGWILCNYCSPFGGVTTRTKNSQSHFDLFDKTQTSYGMWMTPPDVNNDVVVMFPSGDTARAIWIGTVFKEYMNHSVPEAAASDNNKQFFGEGKKIPVTEYNKWDKTGDADDPVNPVRPWHETRFNGIAKQGLIDDEVRGITSSSSMRESPSQVFGINTPGPRNPKTDGARQGGHSFVMDDGDTDGNDSYIGFKTKSGASIRIDDANGLIYAINTKGTSWFQMDADGNVDIFGAQSVTMRSQGDFNVRADGDINLEAGKNVNIKAAQDTDADGNFVVDGEGEGGDINLQALNNMNTLVDDNMSTTVTNGDVNIDIQKGNKIEHVAGNVDEVFDSNLATTVESNIDVKAKGYIHSKADSDFSFDASNAILDPSGNLEINGDFTSVGMADIGADLNVAGMGQFGGDVISGGNGMFSAVVTGSLVASAISVGGGGGGASISASDGDIVFSGIVYADDFQTPAVGLLGHMHTYIDSVGISATPVPKQTLNTSAGGGSGSGPTAPDPTVPAEVTPPESLEPPEVKSAKEVEGIETRKAVNVLEGFDGTIPMNLNNDNVSAGNSSSTIEIPDYWNRLTQDVDTIVSRLPTYEPCPLHKSKDEE